ncbi:peptide chain release factor N(5)-glutamine methyltransferase [Pedobacter immunditicola]|uniref:peptide chain release factor N(5)-glutamine methyltransferase n=1 Tax=Pedobacter immunditicola TaxID=3133440 RepID=UPI0030AB7CD2
MNFKALKEYFISEMTGYEEPQEALALFYMTVEHVSGMGRGKLSLHQELEVKPEEFNACQEIIKQLQQRKPIQYIFKEAHFYGLTFHVDPAVLIPRAETEELVDWILNEVKPRIHRGALLDIGTGSGCIAISLKKHMEEWAVYAMDISAAALTVARQNAEKNKVQVEFIEADVLRYSRDQQFTVIVSNPPYVKEDEKQAMHANVLDNEPHSALFVSNHNPLIFYKAIAELASKNLEKHGYLFFEINEYLGEETVAMLYAMGFNDIVLRKDMQGKDRMICCRKGD